MTEVNNDRYTDRHAEMDLDAHITERSQLYLPLAAAILRECIRIPADYVDLPVDEGGDPASGLSNHEGPRLDEPADPRLR